MVESYRDLKVRQRAIQMTLTIDRLTTSFPKDEGFGRTSQIPRAGVSVAGNTAEEYGQGSRGEDKQLLAMAGGSDLEVQTRLFIASELDYGSPAHLKKAEDLSSGISTMLISLLAKL
jgi:four helix bundle protein